MPLNGAPPESLEANVLPYGVGDDSLYGIEAIDNETGVILDQVPKSGGPWQRLRALGAGGAVMKFQIVGDRYFFDQYPPEEGPYLQPDSNRMNVVTASLDSSDPPVRMLERRSRTWRVDQVWVGTARALYWSDGHAIYARPIP